MRDGICYEGQVEQRDGRWYGTVLITSGFGPNRSWAGRAPLAATSEELAKAELTAQIMALKRAMNPETTTETTTTTPTKER